MTIYVKSFVKITRNIYNFGQKKPPMTAVGDGIQINTNFRITRADGEIPPISSFPLVLFLPSWITSASMTHSNQPLGWTNQLNGPISSAMGLGQNEKRRHIKKVNAGSRSRRKQRSRSINKLDVEVEVKVEVDM